MDLSSLSTADLQALASGDVTKMSTEGLQHISGTPSQPTYGEKVQQAGHEFDVATGPGAKGLGKTAVAFGENVAAGVSGVAGDVVGAATSITTQDPEKGKKVKEAMTFEPRTEGGKALGKYAGTIMQPASDILEKPVKALEKSGHPILAQTAQAVEDVAPLRVPKALREARSLARPAAEAIATAGEERAAVRAAEEAPKQVKIERARGIGLKVPPSEGGGAVGKVLEGASGKIQTEMAFSRANAGVINRTVGKEIGLSDRQSLTEGNIERQKQQAFQSYDKVRAVPKFQTTPEFHAEMDKVRERTAEEDEFYPEDKNELIEKEIKKYDSAASNGGASLAKIKKLRERASRNMQAPDADKFELGLAQKKIATAMENEIERHADAGTVQGFRDARVKLAKIYNVEDALGPNGNVSAAVLARMLKRGVPLSGGLKTIAESYQEFPKVMRYVDNLGGHAPFSALDYLVGGVEAVAHPHKAGAVIGALAGRPIARGIIKSEAYQKAGIRAREVKPGLASRAARKLAGPKVKDLPTERREPTLSDE